jgi:hypothetical protein
MLIFRKHAWPGVGTRGMRVVRQTLGATGGSCIRELSSRVAGRVCVDVAVTVDSLAESRACLKALVSATA